MPTDAKAMDGSLSAPFVCRHSNPLPICRPPGHIEHCDDEKKELTLEDLYAQLNALKEENLTLGERVAEQELWCFDIEDKMDVLRKGLTSKLKRLFEATGNEHLYEAPLP